MCRKLLVISSVFAALVAVNFNTSDAEAARCCRNRSRCCHGGYYGGHHGGCNVGYAHNHCGGCNTGCNVAWNGGCGQQVVMHGCAVQPCAAQGGCPVQGRLIAQPEAAPATAAPAPAPPPEPGAEANPAPAPAPGT